MPVNWRLQIEKQNCWLCKLFRRDDLGADPNQGSCTAKAPSASGAVSNANNQDDVHAHIEVPMETVCGSFEPWDGPARQLLPVVE